MCLVTTSFEVEHINLHTAFALKSEQNPESWCVCTKKRQTASSALLCYIRVNPDQCQSCNRAKDWAHYVISMHSPCLVGSKRQAREKWKFPILTVYYLPSERCVDRRMILHIKGNTVYLYRTAQSELEIKKVKGSSYDGKYQCDTDEITQNAFYWHSVSKM